MDILHVFDQFDKVTFSHLQSPESPFKILTENVFREKLYLEFDTLFRSDEVLMKWTDFSNERESAGLLDNKVTAELGWNINLKTK